MGNGGILGAARRIREQQEEEERQKATAEAMALQRAGERAPAVNPWQRPVLPSAQPQQPNVGPYSSPALDTSAPMVGSSQTYEPTRTEQIEESPRLNMATPSIAPRPMLPSLSDRLRDPYQSPDRPMVPTESRYAGPQEPERDFNLEQFGSMLRGVNGLVRPAIEKYVAPYKPLPDEQWKPHDFFRLPMEQSVREQPQVQQPLQPQQPNLLQQGINAVTDWWNGPEQPPEPYKLQSDEQFGPRQRTNDTPISDRLRPEYNQPNRPIVPTEPRPYDAKAAIATPQSDYEARLARAQEANTFSSGAAFNSMIDPEQPSLAKWYSDQPAGEYTLQTFRDRWAKANDLGAMEAFNQAKEAPAWWQSIGATIGLSPEVSNRLWQVTGVPGAAAAWGAIDDPFKAAGSVGMLGVDVVFDAAGRLIASTPRDELDAFLGGKAMPSGSGKQLPITAELIAAGGVIGQAIKTNTYGDPVRFVLNQTVGALFGQGLARAIGNEATRLFNSDQYQANYGAFWMAKKYIDNLPPELKEEVDIAWAMAPSGGLAVTNASRDLLTWPQQITELETAAQVALENGDFLLAAQLGARSREMKNMGPIEIIEQHMNPLAEVVYGTLVDPVSTVGGFLAQASRGTTLLRYQDEAAQLLNIGGDAARSNIESALKAAQPILSKVSMGQEVNARRWYDTVNPATWFNRTPESKANLDANWLLSTVVDATKGVTLKEDAKTILSALRNDATQMINGLPLNSPTTGPFRNASNLTTFDPGIIGNEQIAKRLPILKLLPPDWVSNLRSLQGEGTFDPVEFVAEVDAVMYQAARQFNGAGFVSGLPAGAADARIRRLPDGTAVVEFVAKDKKVVKTSEAMTYQEARTQVETIKQAAAGNKGNVVVNAVKGWTNFQRGIMSDNFLALSPRNWIRNALGATAMAYSVDGLSMRRVDDIVKDLARDSGGTAPSLRTFATQTGYKRGQELGAAQPSSGFLAPLAERVTGNPDNAVSRIMRGAYDIPYGKKEIPIGGGMSFGVGEEANHIKVFDAGYTRTKNAAWANEADQVRAELIRAGVPEEYAQRLAWQLEEQAPRRSKNELMQILHDIVFSEQGQTATLKAIGTDPDVLPLEQWTRLHDDLLANLDQYTDEEAAQIISNIFDEARQYPSRMLSNFTPQQGRYAWTDFDNALEGGLIQQSLEDAARRAGIDPTRAEPQITAIIEQVKAGDSQWDKVRQDVADLAQRAIAGGSDDARNLYGVAMDFAASAMDAKIAARTAVDKAARHAIALQTPEAWSLKWKTNVDEWGKYGQTLTRMGDEYRTLLGQVASGQPYQPKFDIYKTIKRWMEFDPEKLKQARTYTLGAPVADDSWMWQELIDANRASVDNSLLHLMEAFRRYPSSANFDLLTEAMQEMERMGAKAAGFLDSAKAKGAAGKRLYDLRNETWTQYFDEAVNYNKTMSKIMVAMGVADEAGAATKWVDEFAGGEFRLLYPNEDGTWTAMRTDDRTMHQFAAPGVEGSRPNVPDEVMRAYDTALGRGNTVVNTVMADVARTASEAAPVAITVTVPATTASRVVMLPGMTKNEMIAANRRTLNAAGYNNLKLAKMSKDEVARFLESKAQAAPELSNVAQNATASRLDESILRMTQQDNAELDIEMPYGVTQAPTPTAPATPSLTGLDEMGGNLAAGISDSLRDSYAQSVQKTGNLPAAEYNNGKPSLLAQIYESLASSGLPRNQSTLDAALEVHLDAKGQAKNATKAMSDWFDRKAGVQNAPLSSLDPSVPDRPTVPLMSEKASAQVAAEWQPRTRGDEYAVGDKLRLKDGTEVTVTSTYRYQVGATPVAGNKGTIAYEVEPKVNYTVDGGTIAEVQRATPPTAISKELTAQDRVLLEQGGNAVSKQQLINRFGDNLRAQGITDAQLGRMSKAELIKRIEAAPIPKAEKILGSDLPEGYKLKKGEKFAGAGKWAVMDVEGKPAAGFRNTPEEALQAYAELRKRSDEVSASRISYNNAIEQLKTGNVTSDALKTISGGNERITRTRAIDALRSMGLKETEAKQVLKRAGLYGETSGGAMLYDPDEIVRMGLKKLGKDTPTSTVGSKGIDPGTKMIWRSKDTDTPVTITGMLGEQDGVRYYSIEGSNTGVPANQLIKPRVAKEPGVYTPGDAAKLEIQAAKEARASIRKSWERDIQAGFSKTGGGSIGSIDAYVMKYGRDGLVNLNLNKGELKAFEDVYGTTVAGRRIDSLDDLRNLMQEYVDLSERIKQGDLIVAKSKQFAKMSAQEIVNATRGELVQAGFTEQEIAELAKGPRRSVLDIVAGLRGDTPDEMGMVAYDFAVPTFNEADDGKDFYKTLLDRVMNSRRTGGMKSPEVGEAVDHVLVQLGRAEQKLIDQLPQLRQGLPEALTPQQRLQVWERMRASVDKHDNITTQARMVGEKLGNFVMLNQATDTRNVDAALKLLFPFSFFVSRMPSRLASMPFNKPGVINLYYEMEDELNKYHEREQFPVRLGGSIPVGGDIFMGNLLSYVLPFSTYITPNPYVRAEESDGAIERKVDTVLQGIPGLMPATQYAIAAGLDYLEPKADGTKRTADFELGDYLPLYRWGGYAYQRATGNVGPQGAFAWGDRFDPYRATRTAGAIAAEQGIDDTTTQYAQQIINNRYNGTPDDENVDPAFLAAATKLADQSIKDAGGERAMTTGGSLMTGVPWYQYREGERDMRKATGEYFDYGYNAITNPTGSREAQRLHMEANPGLSGWWSKDDKEPGTTAKLGQLYDQRESLEQQQREAEAAAIAKLNISTASGREMSDAKDAARAPFQAQIDEINAQIDTIKAGQPGKIPDLQGKSQQEIAAALAQGNANPRPGMSPSETSADFLRSAMFNAGKLPGKPQRPEDDASAAEWRAYGEATEAYYQNQERFLNQAMASAATSTSDTLRDARGPQTYTKSQVGEEWWKFRNADNSPLENMRRTQLERIGDAADAASQHQANNAKSRVKDGDKLLQQYLDTPKGDERTALKEKDWRYSAAVLAAYNPDVYDQAIKKFGKDAVIQYFQAYGKKPIYPGEGATEEQLQAYYDASDAFDAKYPRRAEIDLWLDGRYSWQDMNSSSTPGNYDRGAEYNQAVSIFGPDIFDIEREANAASLANNWTGWRNANPDKYQRLIGYQEWTKAARNEPNSTAELPQVQWGFNPATANASYADQPGVRPQGPNPSSVADVLRRPYEEPIAPIGGGARTLAGIKPPSQTANDNGNPKTAAEWANQNEKYAEYGGGGGGGGSAYSQNWDEYKALGDDNDAKRKYMLDHPEFAKYYVGKYGEDSAWWLKGGPGASGEWSLNWDEYGALGDDYAAKRQYMLDHPEFAKYYKERYGNAWWESAATGRSFGGYGGGGGSPWLGGGGGGGYAPRIDPRYMDRSLEDLRNVQQRWRPDYQNTDWLRAGDRVGPDPVRKWLPPRWS